MAWLILAWLGLAWLGLAWLGLAHLGLVWLGLAHLGLAWLGLASLVSSSSVTEHLFFYIYALWFLIHSPIPFPPSSHSR